ncbi:MAG TPA: CheR family methyltransferase, partial [Desulfuromonadales bacterium]|nr:CheR family methyltransferase [Desulfuromonadales bacterium]
TEMPVNSAAKSRQLAPNQVFVIPAKYVLTLEGRTIQLAEREQKPGQFKPIDHFLESLAEQLGERAVSVILSGTGADGTAGTTAVKGAGGITFAQSEDSARFAEMPRNAVQSGHVDLVLPPADIARELGDLVRHPYLGKSMEPADDSATGWDRIQQLLKSIGLDFSQYKPSTVRRRITRRMAIHKLAKLSDYAALLQDDAQELKALREDLLIKVTAFFRDAEAFEALQEKVLPQIFACKEDDQPIRIWVPGCATGEEVYSLAMVLTEFLSDKKAYLSVQIFGSDVSEGAIEKARQGFYLESRLAGVAESRRSKFFAPADGGFQVKKHLREMCIFARQDFISDPPFSRLDLISCRNVLIYFSSALQRKVLPIFHYALNADGFLMLGASENIGQAGELFASVDKKNRIYRRKKAPQHSAIEYWPWRQRQRRPSAKDEAHPRRQQSDEQNLHREVDRFLLRKLDPAALLVDDDWNVVEFRGDTSPFIEHPPGKASLNLLKMTRNMLRADLRTLLQRAKQQESTQRKEGLPLDGPQSRQFTLEVSPLEFDQESFYLVRFMPATAVDEPEAAEEPAEKKSESELRKENRRLQEELTRSHEYNQQLAEEKDEAVEDLKAANEEILSSNEELQSINEEIETAKEELESSNEELTTVNQELQNRNEELAQAHNDLSNLISSVQIPFVIVRNDMKIRRVSDNAEELLQVTPGDVGRSLTDLSLSFEFSDLEQALREVIDSGKEMEREIRDRKGRWNLLRLRPYRTEKGGGIQGAVLALFDIDRLKHSMEQVEEAYKYSLQIVDTIKDPLLVLDEDLRVRKANPAFYQKFQVSPRQTEGEKVYSLGAGQWHQADLRRLLEEILPQSTQMDNYLLEFDFPHLGPRVMMLSARQMQGGTASPESILLAIRDVTEQKQSEEFLRRAKQAAEEASRAKSEFLANISHEIRTPITVILSAVQYLRDTELEPEQVRCAEMAEKSTASLLELLDDILDFSKIEVDKVEIRPAPFDLRENVADALDILRREAVRKGLQLDLQIADDVPQTVLSDWKRLRQVLINLVGNAIKFTEEGMVEVRIEKAAVPEDGDNLVFAIRDTGIGIAAENLDRLFLTFTQLDSSNTRMYGGTGLGLAICKGLVERMGGSIWVESRLGAGS